jgi:hypothetical protein
VLQLLASNILNPRTIDVSLDDIGGLEEVKEEMVRRQQLLCVWGEGAGAATRGAPVGGNKASRGVYG